jgi:hypothetical protein
MIDMMGDNYNQKDYYHRENSTTTTSHYDKTPRVAPTIAIKEDVYRKLMTYARLCNNEISALGTVNIVNGVLLIDSVQLFDQTVSGTSTDLSSEDISKFLFECIKSGKNPESLKFWWHSHVNMGVFWSAIDTDTIDRFKSGWMISMVSNKRNEFKLRIDLFEPFRCTFDNLSLDIDYSSTDIDKIVMDEIRTKVRTFDPIDTFRSALRDAPSFFNRNPAYISPPETDQKNIHEPVMRREIADDAVSTSHPTPQFPRKQDPDRDEYTLFREV